MTQISIYQDELNNIKKQIQELNINDDTLNK
jgi:hypothetical protein